jgi:hypothetical protein
VRFWYISYLEFQKGAVPSFKKGHLLAKKDISLFRDTSKGQGDHLGIFWDAN